MLSENTSQYTSFCKGIQGSVAERSKALALGTSFSEGFESHRCHTFETNL